MKREILAYIVMIVWFLFNIPFWLFLGKRFFKNWQGFGEVVRKCFPWESFWLPGRHMDSELKLGLFFVICLLVFIVPYTFMYIWIMGF